MTLLPLACKPLDELLGNGLESGIITRIYGEAGSGKTNFCLQAARQCVQSKKKVAYIDTESVSFERIRQICADCDYTDIMHDILFFTPTSFATQEQMIGDATALKGVGLIVVDTITMFYRLNLEEDRDGAIRSFTRQITNLQLTARKKDIWVIITEQVFTNKKGEVKPFTNRDAEHMTKTILRFDRKGIGQREATIIKHRSQPEGKKASFRISSNGLE
ncbi:MAG TPA: DNA repair and recombination protein RadB [Thermoplasmata archaeon]|jgi:DNA repair protein RadB|nr:DNA repair and recombination protein RadB [Thermoplasmata archaeon]HIH28754.1 DNA repair and recombination protein RadB [Thermoplasmata archaeon]